MTCRSCKMYLVIYQISETLVRSGRQNGREECQIFSWNTEIYLLKLKKSFFFMFFCKPSEKHFSNLFSKGFFLFKIFSQLFQLMIYVVILPYWFTLYCMKFRWKKIDSLLQLYLVFTEVINHYLLRSFYNFNQLRRLSKPPKNCPSLLYSILLTFLLFQSAWRRHADSR